ncbi:MAG: T9SS type A sorting domain-containing protein [Fluviicola sp.]|nr:T9SS type A sorting domain-containing protein [Fluviicola sp.]
MKALIFTYALIVSFFSLSQNPPILWQQNIGGSGDDLLVKINIPGSTDYFLIGNSDSNISGDKTENSRGFNDIWIVKMDINHTILWDKTIGGDNSDVYRASVVANNELFIVSSSNSTISGEKTIAPFNSSNDIWLLCLDLNGNIQWQSLYGGDGNEGGLSSIIELPNSNLLIGTQSSSGITGNKTEANIGLSDFWLIEVNTIDGTIINQNTIGSSQTDNIRQLMLTPNNTILIVGEANQGVSGDKTDNGYGLTDVWLVETDLNLSVINNICIGGTALDFYNWGNVAYIDGYYYLMTSSSSPISGNKTAPYFGSFDAFERPDYWLIKMDTNFNIIWDRTYGGNVDDNGGNVYRLSNNRLLITGTSETNINGNKTSPKYGNRDFWVLIIDTSGVIIAQETYGGSLDDLLSVSSSTITNGVFYLSGGSESPVSGVKTVPTNGGYDAWILEIDASGFLNTEKIEGVNTTISVYPNPSSGEVNFKFADLEEDVEVTFYSVDGKILFSDKIQSNSVLKSYDLKVGNQMILYSVEGERINYSGKILIR